MEVLEVLVGDPWGYPCETVEEEELSHQFGLWLEGKSWIQAAEQRLFRFRSGEEDCRRQLEEIAENEGEVLVEEIMAASSSSIGIVDGTYRRGKNPLKKDGAKRGSLSEDSLRELFKRDTKDYWRFFGCLERYLQQPSIMMNQILCQIPEAQVLWMIEQYYKLDDSVIRELLVKKMGPHSRKGLDDVADASRVSLRTCQRQFGNLRRLYTSIEDIRNGFYCNVRDDIVQGWLLPYDLAVKYTCVLFLMHSGFKVIIKLQPRLSVHISCEDLQHFAAAIMNYWVRSEVCVRADDYEIVESLRLHDDVVSFNVDSEFVKCLRDMKTSVFGEKDDAVLQHLQNLVNRRLAASSTSKRINIIRLVRQLVTIGGGLAQLKEFRDLFEDIYEKVVEPLSAQIGPRQCPDVIGALLRAIADLIEEAMLSGLQCTLKPHVMSQLVSAWRRFIFVVRICSTRLAKASRWHIRPIPEPISRRLSA